METGLSVGEAMTQRPVQVPPNLSVRDCAKLMRDNDIGSLLVTEGDDLLGIVTEYDITREVVAEGADPEALTVADIMIEELLTLRPEMDVYDALLRMRDNDVRHMPVLEDGKLLGFLTLKDILKIQPQLFELMLDAIDLREEDRKLALRPEGRNDGFCEVCGNFSDRLRPSADRRLACPECRED